MTLIFTMDSLPFIIVYCLCNVLRCNARNIRVEDATTSELSAQSFYNLPSGFISPYERYFPHWIADIELTILNRVVRSTDNKRYSNVAARAASSARIKYLRSLCEQPRGRFRHPDNCHKYLDCWDGRVLEQSCPWGTAYSDLPGGFCDYLEYVDCGGRSTTTTTTTTPPPPPSADDEPIEPDNVIPQNAEPVSSQISAPGIVKLGSSSYIFVIAEKLTWRKARQRCKSLGSNWDLLTIENKEENTLLNNHTSLIEFNSTTKHSYYMGATNIGKSEKDKFYWTATGQEVSYTNWDKDEPNFNKFSNKNTCIQMRDARWSVASCAVKRFYVCEFYRSE